jgi:predicted phosphate transport protein (TIGR00153 family)
MASYSCDAARYLREILEHYDPDQLDVQRAKMHSIEHDGDVARHAMTKKLAKEFITPIEREDIMHMSEMIDNITDKTEDVLLRLHMFNIKTIRPEALDVADIIVKCSSAVKDALEELHNFKKSKSIQELLIEINRLEEVGDHMYTSAVHNVFSEEGIDPLMAIAWNHIFHYMEDVCDACEDVADVIEDVIMKNS